MNDQKSSHPSVASRCLLGMALSVAVLLPGIAAAQSATISGELKCWHKVTLTLDGPSSSETATPNPFADYRMNVTFTHPDSGLTYVVPGYFAADGNAANTGATSGNKWVAHLSPDHAGTWNYSVSFRTGTDVAMNSGATAGTAVTPYDNIGGSFTVAATDKAGRDLRGKGRLAYVGQHHLQFAGTGEYFMKAGTDSPENLLAYDDFDATPNDLNGQSNLRKSWSPHAADYNATDAAAYTWNGGKGSELLGSIKYLSDKGLNAFSFLTFSLDGDDDNVFPHLLIGSVADYESVADNARWANITKGVHHDRFDVSKMAQWEKIFEYGDKKGMYLHFKTQETENDQKMDGGALGRERKLYYRELVARYGHHLAMNWNLGEENTNTEAEEKAFAQWFHDNDPYRHNVVLHTYPAAKDEKYTPLLGAASKLTGVSIQCSQETFSDVFSDNLTWVQNSAAAGKPWVVACDEPGDAVHALRPVGDEGNSWVDGRKHALWGNMMAGGAGVEFYYGYQHANSDLNCQDFRSRDGFWNYCRFALEFFMNNQIPFWEMNNQDALVSGAAGARCLRKAGESYVVQLPNGGSPSLNLSGAPGIFEVKWFDPRNGGTLKDSSVLNVTGGGTVALGSAPNSTTLDWIVLVRQVGGVVANAGPDQTKQFPQGASQVSVSLNGSVSAGGSPFTATWSKLSGPGTVSFANPNAPITTATVTGDPGAYVLQLAATSGTNNASDTITITVNAWAPDSTPPAVSITEPTDGTAVLFGSTVNVTATITDNDAVQSGELFVDGTSQGVDAAAPFAWSVTGLSLGAHTLAVRGQDVSGNAATNSVGITVFSAIPSASSITNLAVQDAYVQITTATSVFDTSPLKIENNSTASRKRDTYLRFVISDIPTGATIKNVKLRLNNQRTTAANGTYVVYAGSSADWQDASPGPNTLSGSLITAGVQLGSFTNPAPSSILNIPLGNTFITGNGSYNLVLKKTTISTGEAEISTSEHATVGLRPALLIDMDVTPQDLLPPEVSFIAPTHGATHPGELPLVVQLDVSDDQRVAEVTLDLDGIVMDGLFAPPWIFDPITLSVGPHLLTAVATDGSGKSTTNSISITSTSPMAPVITISEPADNAEFFEGAAVTLTANVVDDVAVSNVAFYADTLPVASFTAPPYTFSLPNLAVGPHNLTVVATDNGGRVSSNEVNIAVLSSTLDTVQPTVLITAPANGASFQMGTVVNVSASVTDNGAVQVARVYVDGVPAGTDSTSPYQFALANLALGTRTVAVVGQDLSGNAATNSINIQMIESLPPTGVLAACDTVMSAVVWRPATNSAATTPESLLNFGGATNVLVTWNDTGGTNATINYTIKRTVTNDNGNAQLFFFGDLAYTPSTSGAISNLNITVDLAKAAPSIGTVRFALRQGGNIFFSPGVNNNPATAGTVTTFALSGLNTVTLATNGVTHTASATWLAYPSGAKLNFINGSTIEFGIGLLANLPTTVLTASRGPILDNYCLGVNTSAPLPDQPFLQMTPDAGGLLLAWTPASYVLEQTERIESGEWFEVEGATSPHLVVPGEAQQFFRTRAPVVEPPPPPPADPLVLWATTNFPSITAGAVPAYKDAARNALAINASIESYRGQFAAAETTFAGTAGDYSITITTLTETDGECTYRLLVNGVQRGTFTNPRSSTDYQEVNHTWSGIAVPAGATIRVEFNTHSNGLIPEAGGFAWARGRWRRLTLEPNISAPSGVWVESGGVVVMEAEKTTSPLGNWAFSTTITPGWTGTGHLQFNGNAPAGGSANSPLTYQFKITQTGTYRLYLRARKNLEGAPTDQCNDCYLRMAGSYTAAGGVPLSVLQNNTKFFGGLATSWGWAAQLDDMSQTPDVKYNAVYNFTAGEVYTLTMSGRSQRFNVDRIVLRLNGVADATWQNAPESSRAP